MGVVLAAYDAELDRKVAIKLMHPQSELDLQGHAALLREAQSMARLAHPNVVAVHEVGVVEGAVFVAMEYVAGVDLQRWLADRPRPWREVVGVLRQAGLGLMAAHREGLIHRDFKPESCRFSLRTPSSRETPRISSLEGVGGKIGCPGLPQVAPQ
jgi:serine/threonine protein kinase